MRPMPCHPIVPCPSKEMDTGRFLLQRIHGSGTLHRRAYRYSLPLDNIPCHLHPPFTLVDISVSGTPVWQKIPCREKNMLRLQVHIPLLLTLCTDCGEHFTTASCIDETLMLRLSCPPSETWRCQLHVCAAVRQACACTKCTACSCSPLLDVLLEGHLLSPCTMAGACPLPCPPDKPWYPTPPCGC